MKRTACERQPLPLTSLTSLQGSCPADCTEQVHAGHKVAIPTKMLNISSSPTQTPWTKSRTTNTTGKTCSQPSSSRRGDPPAGYQTHNTSRILTGKHEPIPFDQHPEEAITVIRKPEQHHQRRTSGSIQRKICRLGRSPLKLRAAPSIPRLQPSLYPPPSGTDTIPPLYKHPKDCTLPDARLRGSSRLSIAKIATENT